MTPDKSSIIEKVRKLLAHKDNPNQNEAENAMLLAQRMMAEHNLVTSDVELKNMVKEVIHGQVLRTQKLPWWQFNLSGVIANNFRCYSIRYRGGVTELKFIGIKEDVQVAIDVFNYAVESIEYNCKIYVKAHKNGAESSVAIRNAYIRGFITGIHTKFEDQKKAHQEWGLVLVKDPEVVKAHDSLGAKKAHDNEIKMGGFDHTLAGYQAGKQFTPIAGKISGGD